MSEDRRVDARDIDRALARGAEKNRRLAKALDTIATELERDPGAAARVLRNWMNETPRFR
jgi:flagellar biosynthesis/type III secretory pathway M-ring protein FliF/YscJ